VRRLPDFLRLASASVVLAAGALAQTDAPLEPVRPGIPGSRPFWNAHARRFIYPPAFEAAEVPGAGAYRFTLVSSADSLPRPFVSAHPWDPLTPVWSTLPDGVISLRIQTQIAGDTTTVFERTFIKSPPFAGEVTEPAYSFRESARRCLHDLLGQEKVQAWLRKAEPFAYYPKYAYPAKMVSAVIEGMATFARITEDAGERLQALAIAESAATFLRAISVPPERPLAGWPPTFWEGVDRDIHPIYPDEVLVTEPARAGMAYLSLYEVSGNPQHLASAHRIAETYLRTQLPGGSWYQRLRVDDGSAKVENLLVPTLILTFLDRLRIHDDLQQYARASERAYRWIMEHPMESSNWEAQFEDTRPRSLYRNLSHREPVQFARYLFRRAGGDQALLEQAEELLRFAEDGFVIWQADDPVCSAQLFRPGSRWNGNDPYFGSDWFVPAAVEQYVFFTPISSSSAGFIEAYCAAYRATRDRRFLDRARALGSTLTRAQRYWGGGEIPTHLRRVMPELNWLNVSVWSAVALLELDAVMREDTEGR